MSKPFKSVDVFISVLLILGLIVCSWAVPGATAAAAVDNPYQISQHDYQFVDNNGNDRVGYLLCDLTGLANGYVVIVHSIEAQGNYQAALERLNEKTIPDNMPIEIYTAYKNILEAKRSDNQRGVDLIVRDNLGALILGASKNVSGYQSIKEAKDLEAQNKYVEAANLLKNKFGQQPDALIYAYQAVLRTKAASVQDLQPNYSDHGVMSLSKAKIYNDAVADMEAAVALAPSNRMLYTWLGELYKTAGIKDLNIFVNGAKIKFDVPPASVSGRTMVPFRPFVEALGAGVEWNPTSKTVSMTKGSQTIILTMGKSTAVVDGKEVKMDVAPLIIKGRAMVPLRFIGETMHADVSYDGNYNLIKVVSAQ